MEKKKIIFLYTEIATYFLACAKKLAGKGVEVHIVRWAVNKEAPFQFAFPENIKVYERNNYNDEQLLSLVTDIAPDIIVCSGWVDKGYMKVCGKFQKRAKTVLTLDNQWWGNIRQQIARIISPFYLKRFSHCWVPGKPQYEYARRLGFKSDRILTGFYSCDFDFFFNQYNKNKEEKQKHFPLRFLYVGRYVEHKGIKDMFSAFAELQHESPSDWELWCIGTGDVEPVKHPKIRHFGFVQPDQLPEYIKNTGVFVLPSHFEPWGVVVHEFCASGFPVICSDKVGAASTFVENNYNGYIYRSEDVNALKAAMKKMMDADQGMLPDMADKSVEKSKKISPEIWAEQILSILL